MLCTTSFKTTKNSAHFKQKRHLLNASKCFDGKIHFFWQFCVVVFFLLLGIAMMNFHRLLVLRCSSFMTTWPFPFGVRCRRRNFCIQYRTIIKQQGIMQIRCTLLIIWNAGCNIATPNAGHTQACWCARACASHHEWLAAIAAKIHIAISFVYCCCCCCFFCSHFSSLQLKNKPQPNKEESKWATMIMMGRLWRERQRSGAMQYIAETETNEQIKCEKKAPTIIKKNILDSKREGTERKKKKKHTIRTRIHNDVIANSILV